MSTNRVTLRSSTMPDSPMDVKTQCRVTSPTLLSPPTTQGASTDHNSAGDPSCASNGIPSPSNGCAARPSSSSSSSSTSSSPSASSPSVTPQLPPACGARQLSKLKRFLATLQQFASDISPEIGEQVHALVLGLLNSTLTIEQFHSRLQEATNFPLRPTVVPFLKANVPLLQCELIHCARLAKQNPTQYLAQHEQLLLSTRTSSPVDSAELLWDVNKNPKRKPAGRTKENDADQEPLHLYPPSKKQCTISPYRQNGLSHMPLPLAQSLCADGTALAHHRSDSHRPPSRREHREQNKANRTHNARREETVDHRLTDKEWADEWKHLDHLLNCIRDMVEKTRHSLTVLRRCQEADREELGYWARRCSDAEDVKKGSSTSQSKVQSPGGQNPGLAVFHRAFLHRAASECVPEEIWKKAEDAVNEVKKQAMAELQSAVSEAERRAQEMIRSERAKMEQAVAEARRRAAEDLLLAVNQQEDSTESCWNCGRRASETCSGCSTARYCGSFCQHKDWERHHHVCSRTPPAHQHDDRSPSACSSSLHTSDTGGPADTPPANTPPEVTPHSTPPLTAGAAVQ